MNIHLAPSEYNGLSWLSDRYGSADVCGSGRWEDDDPFANGRLGGTRYHGVTFPR